MNVMIFGSTGGIGRHAVEQALQAGHTVTAVARTPDKLAMQHPNLSIARGDVLDAAVFEPGGAVRAAMAGQQAVISAIGTESNAPTTLYSDGLRHIAAAMQAEGVRRLLCISATGLEPGPLFQRIVAKPILWHFIGNMYADLVRMEDFVKSTALDWTIVRPPRLTDGPRTGRYQVKINRQFRFGGFTLSRADAADFMITRLADPQTFCATVEVAY